MFTSLFLTLGLVHLVAPGEPGPGFRAHPAHQPVSPHCPVGRQDGASASQRSPSPGAAPAHATHLSPTGISLLGSQASPGCPRGKTRGPHLGWLGWGLEGGLAGREIWRCRQATSPAGLAARRRGWPPICLNPCKAAVLSHGTAGPPTGDAPGRRPDPGPADPGAVPCLPPSARRPGPEPPPPPGPRPASAASSAPQPDHRPPCSARSASPSSSTCRRTGLGLTGLGRPFIPTAAATAAGRSR